MHQGLPFGEDIPLGVMIEVPAAALCIDSILNEVDFVSIGSNDLIQYVMAADRDNPKVAYLCEPFHPAIFRLLHTILRACHEHNKPVTVCGEMAGRPRCFVAVVRHGFAPAEHESRAGPDSQGTHPARHPNPGPGSCRGGVGHEDSK